MGKGVFGFDLLRKQVIDHVASEVQSFNDWIPADSEIEKLFLAALIYRLRYDDTEFRAGVLFADSDEKRRAAYSHPDAKVALIVEPQVPIGRYRVDFIVSAWTEGTVYSKSGRIDGVARWRRLIVECDGHDFHEKTKAQAAKDKARDRELTSHGYEIFRFTGSELWRDPWECARQVYDWAARGF